MPMPWLGSGDDTDSRVADILYKRPTRRQIKNDHSGSHDFRRFLRQF